MPFFRASAARGAFRTAQSFRSTIGRSQQWRQAGRRGYASHGHNTAKSSSDIPWAIGAIAVTGPTCWYLLSSAPEDAHGGLKHPSHGHEEHHEEEGEKEEEGESEGDDKASEKSDDSEDSEKSEDSKDTPDSSDDEGEKEDKKEEGDNKHSTNPSSDPEKSSKSDGSPETAKAKDKVDPKKKS